MGKNLKDAKEAKKNVWTGGGLDRLRGQIRILEMKIGKLSLIKEDISRKMNKEKIKNVKLVEELEDKILVLCKKEIEELEKKKRNKEEELEKEEVEIAYINKKLKLLEELKG